VLVAWLLARFDFPGKTLLDSVVHLPLVLPPVVTGYFLLVLLGTRGPIGGWLLETFGVRLIFTRWGAAVAAAVMSFPLMVRAIRLALEAVDRGLESAARTLGASRFDVFVSVTLPLMLPGIVSGCIVAFAAALGDFGATITFVGNVQGETQTLSLAIYSLTQTPDGDAAALRLVVISLVLALSAYTCRSTGAWRSIG
jgi:molybdate transport system permease protein